jgi:hypothetical protein
MSTQDDLPDYLQETQEIMDIHADEPDRRDWSGILEKSKDELLAVRLSIDYQDYYQRA